MPCTNRPAAEKKFVWRADLRLILRPCPKNTRAVFECVPKCAAFRSATLQFVCAFVQRNRIVPSISRKSFRIFQSGTAVANPRATLNRTGKSDSDEDDEFPPAAWAAEDGMAKVCPRG